ncbi:MAG: hypothetical protein ACOYXT_15530 [Bacteroidota bacterium]
MTRHFIFLAILLPVGITTQCQSTRQQQSADIAQIEFNTLTRGFNKNIRFTPDSIVAAVSGREGDSSDKRAIEKNQWQSLISTLKTLPLTDIPGLKSPSMKRAYDGARHSTISVKLKNGETFIHSFDDEQPAPELQNLMEAIIKLEKLKAKSKR